MEINIKITIITAVYNRKNTIAMSIKSVNSQTYSNIQHVIIDGLSSDGTVDIVRNNMMKNAILISEPDNGIYDALNKGIIYSSGEIIGLMHSDDFFSDSHVLDEVANAFLNHDIDIVYGDLSYIDKDDPEKVIRYWKAGEYTEKSISYGWMPPHPALFIRKRVFDYIGFYNVNYKISSDYEFILRYFSKMAIRSIYIPRVLVKMRLGGISNQSLKKILIKSLEDYTALRSNNIGGVLTLLCKNIRKYNQLSYFNKNYFK